MDEPIRKPADCRVFRDNLFLFQSDEMGEADRAVLQDHLDRCGDCAGLLAREDALLAALRRSLPREPAPAGLEQRIRQALAAARPEDRRQWWKSPAVAALAAVFLLAALLAPVVLNRTADPAPRGFTGTIVDLECDRYGLPLDLQRECDIPGHLNALRLEDGSYVHFNLHQAEYSDYLLQADMRGRRVTVRGTLHPEIRTLEVLGVEERSGPL